MITRLVVVLLLVFGPVVSPRARAEGSAANERTHLYDLSPDTVPVGTGEFALFWARYTRGFTDNLQGQTQLGLDAVSVLNATVRWRFLDRPQLRAAVEGGVTWAALFQLLQLSGGTGGAMPVFLFAPIELRAAVPVRQDIELYVLWGYRWFLGSAPGIALGSSSLRVEATLVRYDEKGAWFLQGRFPLTTNARVNLDSLLGAGSAGAGGGLTLDDVDSFGFLAGRDFTFGEKGHVRVGAGWRRTPGIVFVESFGNLLLNFDVYWR